MGMHEEILYCVCCTTMKTLNAARVFPEAWRIHLLTMKKMLVHSSAWGGMLRHTLHVGHRNVLRDQMGKDCIRLVSHAHARW